MTIRHALSPAATAEDVARLLPQLAEHAATRRGLMLAPLLAALPLGLMSGPAAAIDPGQTQVTLPDQYQWKPALAGVPPHSVETAPLVGATDKPGPYVVLIKWYPGYMSAPHNYVTRPAVLCAVRHLVGEFRRKLRPRRHRAGPRRRLHPPRRPHPALRRGQERRQGAGHNWHFRRGSHQCDRARSRKAPGAGAIGGPAARAYGPRALPQCGIRV